MLEVERLVYCVHELNPSHHQCVLNALGRGSKAVDASIRDEEMSLTDSKPCRTSYIRQLKPHLCLIIKYEV